MRLENTTHILTSANHDLVQQVFFSIVCITVQVHRHRRVAQGRQGQVSADEGDAERAADAADEDGRGLGGRRPHLPHLRRRQQRHHQEERVQERRAEIQRQDSPPMRIQPSTLAQFYDSLNLHSGACRLSTGPSFLLVTGKKANYIKIITSISSWLAPNAC